MPLVLLVSDTSVLVDLERGGLLATVFGTGLTMIVPDLLYESELAEYSGPYYRELGLQVVELSPDEVAVAQHLYAEHAGLSTPDCFALACAQRPGHALLTSDGLLRRVAERRGVTRYGLLWLLDQVLELDATLASALHEGLSKIAAHPQCRQPANEVAKRLVRWSSVGT
jgi:hypothetical protein